MMYREAFAAAADERGWRVCWYERERVFCDAAAALGHEDIDAFPYAMGGRSPPWQMKQNIAVAAAIAAAASGRTCGDDPQTAGTMTGKQGEELLGLLKARFESNMRRHKALEWKNIEAKLKAAPRKLWSLNEMEITGGEPDVVAYDKKAGEYLFYDCSAESPKGRRSLCYDREALESRKEHKPGGNAIDLAAAMGVELLTEDEYRELQKLGEFDTKTSSWVKTPPAIRKLGGALFCDRRYNTVFVYHNGAESYYAARGFRASLRV